MISSFIGISSLRCALPSVKVLAVEAAVGSGEVPTAIRAACPAGGGGRPGRTYILLIIYSPEKCEPPRSPYVGPMPGRRGSPRGPSGETLGAHSFYLCGPHLVTSQVCHLKTRFKAFPRILLLAHGFDRRWCYNVRDLGVCALVVDVVRPNPQSYG